MWSVKNFAMMTPTAIIEQSTSGYIMNPPSAKSVRRRYWEPTKTSLLVTDVEKKASRDPAWEPGGKDPAI
jgi:hypothetical protein